MAHFFKKSFFYKTDSKLPCRKIGTQVFNSYTSGSLLRVADPDLGPVQAGLDPLRPLWKLDPRVVFEQAREVQTSLDRNTELRMRRADLVRREVRGLLERRFRTEPAVLLRQVEPLRRSRPIGVRGGEFKSGLGHKRPLAPLIRSLQIQKLFLAHF